MSEMDEKGFNDSELEDIMEEIEGLDSDLEEIPEDSSNPGADDCGNDSVVPLKRNLAAQEMSRSDLTLFMDEGKEMNFQVQMGHQTIKFVFNAQGELHCQVNSGLSFCIPLKKSA